MTKKQKTVLYRIIASAILILGISILCEFADVNIWGQVVLYLIPYFVIGYDILRKAFKGILNKQVGHERPPQQDPIPVYAERGGCNGSARRTITSYG